MIKINIIEELLEIESKAKVILSKIEDDNKKVEEIIGEKVKNQSRTLHNHHKARVSEMEKKVYKETMARMEEVRLKYEEKLFVEKEKLTKNKEIIVKNV